VALLLVAALGLVGVAAGLRVFAAGCTVGLLGAGTALLGYLLSAEGAAAVLISLLVCGIGVLPLLAIRLGKLPMPPVTLPTGAQGTADFTGGSAALDAARDRPERGRVFAAVTRTERLLTGMLVGHAVLSVLAAVVLVVAGGFSGRLLAAVAAVALLLRCRLFITARQRVPLLLAGLLGLGVLAGALVWRAQPGELPAYVAAGVVVALVVVAAGATYSRRPPSPYLGRAADLLDTLIVISVIPVACAVLDLYSSVRGLAG
jgi:type VII secretion integral membrane protein EccD